MQASILVDILHLQIHFYVINEELFMQLFMHRLSNMIGRPAYQPPLLISMIDDQLTYHQWTFITYFCFQFGMIIL